MNTPKRFSRHLLAGLAYLGVVALLAVLNVALPPLLPESVRRLSPVDVAIRSARKAPELLQEKLLTDRIVIRRGKVIGDYLAEYGLDRAEIVALLDRIRPVYDLAMIRAGQVLEVARSTDGLRGFRYHIDQEGFLEVGRAEAGWVARRMNYPFEWEQGFVEGRIRDNLFNEIERLGEEPTLALALAELFAWDVDFYADLREGDRFRILFQRKRLDGRNAGYGPILAAEFVNQGQTFRAFRHEFPDGRAEYYTLDGLAVRKELLKSPLKLGTVTSRFSRRRLHPVLKIYRPHHGVDIAAPVGTPVHAAGDGTVSYAGYRGQAGRMVEIRHANRYASQYLHLSRFARGVRAGSRVRQGEVIAYVGSSGSSTGPHLDYRIQLNGGYVNPLKQQFERALPLPAEHRLRFERQALAWGRVLEATASLRHFYLAEAAARPSNLYRE